MTKHQRRIGHSSSQRRNLETLIFLSSKTNYNRHYYHLVLITPKLSDYQETSTSFQLRLRVKFWEDQKEVRFFNASQFAQSLKNELFTNFIKLIH
jgi:hypothetical protein